MNPEGRLCQAEGKFGKSLKIEWGNFKCQNSKSSLYWTLWSTIPRQIGLQFGLFCRQSTDISFIISRNFIVKYHPIINTKTVSFKRHFRNFEYWFNSIYFCPGRNHLERWNIKWTNFELNFSTKTTIELYFNIYSIQKNMQKANLFYRNQIQTLSMKLMSSSIISIWLKNYYIVEHSIPNLWIEYLILEQKKGWIPLALNQIYSKVVPNSIGSHKSFGSNTNTLNLLNLDNFQMDVLTMVDVFAFVCFKQLFEMWAKEFKSLFNFIITWIRCSL